MKKESRVLIPKYNKTEISQINATIAIMAARWKNQNKISVKRDKNQILAWCVNVDKNGSFGKTSLNSRAKACS
ncbi:24338_t:CDS:2 [Dentiscutata erythropus]|uniref:24338_t:CDS:1 n=1 Tax=Dentiscutata erythropus TaxID=1348616 RepID=A0A9N9F047_9GLOM|nr:24338_t:CDS:2 [Dentiscutata erythropus]